MNANLLGATDDGGGSVLAEFLNRVHEVFPVARSEDGVKNGLQSRESYALKE